jgi:hypothetical protein
VFDLILKVKLEEISCKIDTRINIKNEKINMSFGEVITTADLPHYEGEYTVIPKTEEQTLKTANKVMSDNLVVEKIPYYEVTNTANGKTVTIA